MVSSPKVSAVLITRGDAWPTQVPLPSFPFDEVLLETRCAGIHRRFELAQEARNEVIYVQDDDCVIDVPALWSQYDGQLTHAITPGHYLIYKDTGCHLIGWGAFFPRALINFQPWYDAYPDTPIPSHEYDRVFTFLAHPIKSVIMPIEQVRLERAMSRDNPDHYASRDRIIKMLQAKVKQ